MKKIYILVVIILFAVIGFFAYTKFYKKAAVAPVSNPLNIAYTVEGQTYILSNGKAEIVAAPGSSSKNVVTVFGEPVYGDLNSDGTPDAGVLLSLDTSGSGTFYYLVASILKDDKYESTNAILLGDRIAPQNILIKDGKLLANYADRGPKDPMTVKPYIGITKRTYMENGELKELLSMKGRIVFGEGVRTFQPCGEDQGAVESQWVVGNSPAYAEITKLYNEKMIGSGPYSPMYAEVIGKETAVPQDGFGADYTKAIYIEQLVASSATGNCKQDLIVLENIKPGDYINTKLPLELTGKARGNWYFEASFPIEILDRHASVLATGFATAQGEWMTTEFVPFKSTIKFTKTPPANSFGKIVLHKDNPSDMRELDDALEILVYFK